MCGIVGYIGKHQALPVLLEGLKRLGIPVAWNHISNAKVIVETELPDFKVDPSLGSHFFHIIEALEPEIENYNSKIRGLLIC